MIKDKKQDCKLKLDKTNKYFRQKIPPALYSYLDFFLKKELDTQVLYRLINYKIKLIEENTLSFYYLNKYLLKELVVI